MTLRLIMLTLVTAGLCACGPRPPAKVVNVVVHRDCTMSRDTKPLSTQNFTYLLHAAGNGEITLGVLNDPGQPPSGCGIYSNGITGVDRP